jgi:hypothetical protein
VIAAIDLPPQGGSLQGTGTEIEGEGNECIELPLGKRHGDQAQDSTFGGLHVLAQQSFCLFGGNATRKLFPFLWLHHMPIPDGGITSGADVHGGPEAFELLDEVNSSLCYMAHDSSIRT